MSAAGNKQPFFIAGFYCSEKKLVIELDGGIHALQVEYDIQRDEEMKELGIAVLRFTNDQVSQNVYAVVTAIKERLRTL